MRFLVLCVLLMAVSFYSLYNTIRRLQYAEQLGLDKKILEGLLVLKVILIEIFMILVAVYLGD